MMNILSYAARFLQLKKIQTDEALKNGITAVHDKSELCAQTKGE